MVLHVDFQVVFTDQDGPAWQKGQFSVTSQPLHLGGGTTQFLGSFSLC